MATGAAQSASFNIVMSSAIRGANFLQASVKGIHTYAKQVENIRLLKGTNFATISTKAKQLEKTQLLRATKFGSLNSNIKTLDNHLTKLAIKANQIAKTTIKFDVNREGLMGARKDLTAMAKDSQTIFNYSKQTNRVRNQKPLASAPVQTKTIAQNRLSSFKGTTATDVVAKGFIAGTMLLPFKPAVQFEEEMARVKALSRATPLEFKGLVTEAKNLGANTQWKATEVSQGMSYLSMAGFKPKETQQAMSGVLSLATAGKTDLATTSDIASNILSGFELKASSMDHVADVMARTITTSNTTVQMLGDTFKYVAPVSSKLGADLTEVAALTAKMGDVGIQGSQSGTALRAMYSRLSAPPKSAGKALDALDVKTFDESGKFKGMINIIGELKSSLSDKTEEEKSSYIKDIFGMEAMSGALAVMAVGKDKLLEYQSALKNSKGASKEIADIQLDTTAGQFKLFGSAMEGLSISVTSNLLPTISMITKGVTTLTSNIQSFSEQYPTLTSVVIGGTASLLAGGIALTAFGFASSMAVKGIQSLGFLKSLIGRFSNLSSVISKATAKQKAFNSLLSVKGFGGVPGSKSKKPSFTKVAKNSKFSTFPIALESQLPSFSKRRVKTSLERKATKKTLLSKALIGNSFNALSQKETFTKVAKGSKFSTVANIASSSIASSSIASMSTKKGSFTKVAKNSTFSKTATISTAGIKRNISLMGRFNSLISRSTMLLSRSTMLLSRSTMLLRGIGMALVSNPLGMAVKGIQSLGFLKSLIGRFSNLSSVISKATKKQKAFNSLLSVKGFGGVPGSKSKKPSFTKVAKNSKFSTFPIALESQLPSFSKRRVKTSLERKATKKTLLSKALIGNSFNALSQKETFTKVAKGSKFSTVANIASSSIASSSIASMSTKKGSFTKVAKNSTFSKTATISTAGIKRNISLMSRFNSLISRSTMLLRGIGMALVSNPLGMAVTAMVASGMLLYSNWKPIKAFFVGFGQGVSQALSPLAGTIRSVFGSVLSIFTPVANMAKRIFKWFGEITGASKWSKKELDGVASTGKKVGLIVGKVFTMAMTPVKMLLKAIQTVLNAIGSVSKKIKTVMSDAKKAVVSAKNNMVKKVTNIKNKALSFIGLGDKNKKTITSKSANNVITKKPTFNKDGGVLTTHNPKATFESSPLKSPNFHKTKSFNSITENHLNNDEATSSVNSSVKKTDVSIGNISVAVHTKAKDLDADMVQAKVEKALREIKFNDADLAHEDLAS